MLHSHPRALRTSSSLSWEALPLWCMPTGSCIHPTRLHCEETMRLVILALAAVLTFQVAQAQEQRLALVIGNAGYKAAPLRNPVNDARAITTVLRAFGFEVLQLENATARTMKRAIVDFGNRFKGGG